MNQSWIWKLFLSFGLLVLAVYMLVPTYVYFSLPEDQLREVKGDKTAFAKYLPSWSKFEGHIVPGLDLQGGIHIALGVDVDKAISDRTTRMADRLMDQAKEKKLLFSRFATEGEQSDTTVRISFASSVDRQAFRDAMKPQFGELQVFSETDNDIVLRMDPSQVEAKRRDAVDQTINTIRTRIDKMGVTEPSISKRGSDQIQIQLPGYYKSDEAKALIGRTAQLEFQMLDDQSDFLKKLQDLPEGVVLRERLLEKGNDIYLEFAAKDSEKVKTYLKGKVPDNNIIKYGRPDTRSDLAMMRTYTLAKKVDLTGDDLVDAKVDLNSTDGVAVSLMFTPNGGRIFEEVSGSNIGRNFAIVLEDNVDSIPVFKSKIPAGHGAQITMGGGRTQEESLKEASQLALVLKSGALPAPVSFREERSVGPSLGADSVDKAQKAFMWGGILIILFMILYYRVAGMISVLGVTFNVIFILAAMAALGATITLPGVAGLLLTIGLAVDTNVIINERIREELRRGKMPRSAVKAGYEAAFSAVIDSHVTTFISGMILWQFGTGPVQNFATTIMIGTVFSIFTGVVITRIFFEALTSRGPQTISI